MKYLPWALVGLFGLILIGTLFVNPLAESARFGTIDIGRIIEESPRAQELNERLAEKYNQLIEEIGEDEELEIEEELAERERQAYAEYLRYRQELEDQFQAELDEVISQIVKERNLEIVLDKDVVRHGGMDITEEIIRNM